MTASRCVFEAPHSFTGEDVLELQGHGVVVVSRMVLERVCELGARVAKAGEFTLRAFLNDRIDLAQAEAIADLIDSASTSAARCARRSLSGEFSRTVESHRDALVELRSFIEAAIDFPDEELDLLGTSETAARLAALRDAVAATLADSHRGAVLRSGVRLVIAGAPNVGKSSLLNRLARTDTAIVTDTPGTTRDVVRETGSSIAGVPFDVHDTAGFRATSDPVERIGVERAARAIDDADLVLVVVDDRDAARDADLALLERAAVAPVRIVVRNKIDLSGREPQRHGRWTADADGSRVRSQGIWARRTRGGDCRMRDPRTHGSRRRIHSTPAPRRCAGTSVRRSGTGRSAGWSWTAPASSWLRSYAKAQDALGEITGAFATEDLLAHIFSSFCIGK